MNSEQERASANETEMTPNKVLAEGWRLTRAILALKGMEIPYTIKLLIEGTKQIQATRVRRLRTLLALLNFSTRILSG